MLPARARRPVRAFARAAARWGLRLTGGLLLAAALGVALGVVGVVIVELPGALGTFPAADLAPPADSLRVYDRGGALLAERVNAAGARQRWRSLDELSPRVVEATLAVEDARFFEHGGVEWRSVVRAVVTSVAAGRLVSGASTLTMQLARLIHPRARPFRGMGLAGLPTVLAGKWREMVEAERLERALSKREILEQYLNRAAYGAGTVGAEAASVRVYGVPSQALSWGRAALIAGLPGAPSRFNPLRHFDAALGRQRWVLWRLYVTDRLSRAEYHAALDEDVTPRPGPRPHAAQHVVDMAVKAKTVETGAVAAGAVAGGRRAGGDVHTTIDGALQRRVEALVARHVGAFAVRGGTQAAAVVLDANTCEVRALVGSGGYGGRDAGSYNAALAHRQPGSTLKPFTYALAFEGGSGPGDVLPDVPTRYGDAADHLYTPRNFHRTFVGPVMMGDALAQSLNVPAVRLAERVGVERLLGALRALGVRSLDRPAGYYGLGLTLGNGEVTPLELAQAYAALARGGLACRARWRRGDGAGLPPAGDLPARVNGERVFSPQASFLVSRVLADEARRTVAFGASQALRFDYPVAAKTGTSANWRDAWVAGFTLGPQPLVVVVWVGDPGGRSTQRLTGVGGAGPLFHDVVEAAVERRGEARVAAGGTAEAQPAPAPPPPGVERRTVCALSGLAPTPACPHTRVVWAHTDAPRVPCTWHKLGKDGARHLELPPEYAEWASLWGPAPEAAVPGGPVGTGAPARSAAGVGSSGGAGGLGGMARAGHGPSLQVVWPRPGERFALDPSAPAQHQAVELRARAEPRVERVTWWVDGVRVGEGHPQAGMPWRLRPGTHRAWVQAGRARSAAVEFSVRERARR